MRLAGIFLLVALAAVLAWAWRYWSDPLARWSYTIVHDENPEARIKAIDAIAENYSRLDPDRVVPLLIKATRDPNPKIRMSAVLILPGYGKHSLKAIPHIMDTANDNNTSVIVASIDSLGHYARYCKAESVRVIPVLEEALLDKEEAVRLHAKMMLSRASLAESE